MKTAIRLGLLTLIAGAFAGCASIMDGSQQNVTFNSTPPGATVMLEGRPLGTTPMTINLDKKPNQVVVFAKDGYAPLSMELETRLDGWFWGNILFGGFVGSTTDGLSGAANEYSPNQYFVTLQPSGTASMETNTATSAQQKANQYIIVAYKDIVAELNSAPGSYMSSLFDMLKIAPEDRPEAAKKIKALSEVYTDIPDFADHVVELYLKGAASAAPEAPLAPPIAPPIAPPGEPPLAPPSGPEIEVARAQWSAIAPAQEIRVYAKSGETYSGTFLQFDGDYLWLELPGWGKKSLAESDIVKVTLLK